MFFVTFNISHVFPENFIEVPQVVQNIWRFSSIFINLLDFLLSPHFTEYYDVSI